MVAEVRAAFDRYGRGLDENDVAVLDGSFWDSPHTLRCGVTENLYGHAETAGFRASRTPTQHQARARRLENIRITSFGQDFAVANTEFVILGNGRRGRQSQTWVRLSEGWKVVAAHVGLLPDA